MKVDLLEYFSDLNNCQHHRFCDGLVEVSSGDIVENQDQIIYLVIDNEYKKVVSVVGLIAEVE